MQIERYPTIRAPGEVAPRAVFNVEVSLTVDEQTPEVSITGQDAGTPLHLCLPRKQSWDVQAVVVAPDFDVGGDGAEATLELPRSGDSSPVMFTLTAPAQPGRKPIWVTFWHEGQFLGEAVRPVWVGTSGALDTPGSSPARATVSLTLDEQPPDLTLWVLVSPSVTGGQGGVVLSSPWIGGVPHASTLLLSSAFTQRLEQQQVFLGKEAQRVRGVEAPNTEGSRADASATITAARAYGRTLYDQLFPEDVKRALAAIYARRGPGFSLQIYTSEPGIPWELASFRTEQGQWRDFLGIETRIARWHIDEQHRGKQRPPGVLSFGRMLSVVPSYEGNAMLPRAAAELESLPSSLQARLVKPSSARREAVVATLKGEAESIGALYFAGHGAVKEGSSDFFIILQDGDTLAASEWPRLVPGARVPRFVFLNACSQGQEALVAGKMAGWASAVIEAGGDAYLGGIWPLGDEAAANFAAHFYRRAADGLPLAEAVRHARMSFLTTGDPTYLSYVFYGDPMMTLFPEGTP